MPDHTFVVILADDRSEARYIYTILKSSCAGFVARSFVALQPMLHVMGKGGVIRFDRNKPVHFQLAQLSEEAHTATAASDTARVAAIEPEIDQ